CHGTRGLGGPNVHVGDAALLATATNGFLREAIRGGRPGTKMPAFEQTLGEQGVEDVVALLRSWEPRERPKEAAPVAHPAPLPLGPVPLHTHGPEPRGFKLHPE